MILLLTDRRKFGIQLANRLLSSGLLVQRASTDAGYRLCVEKDTGGVLLDTSLRPDFANQLASSLRALYPDLPILFLSPSGSGLSPIGETLTLTEDLDLLSGEILRFCRDRCGWIPDHSVYALQLSADQTGFFYLGYPLRLPKRASSVLRLLFEKAPEPVSCDDILSVCFPEGDQTAENAAVTVSLINRKASEISGFRLVESVRSVGYRLTLGIVDRIAPPQKFRSVSKIR